MLRKIETLDGRTFRIGDTVVYSDRAQFEGVAQFIGTVIELIETKMVRVFWTSFSTEIRTTQNEFVENLKFVRGPAKGVIHWYRPCYLEFGTYNRNETQASIVLRDCRNNRLVRSVTVCQSLIRFEPGETLIPMKSASEIKLANALEDRGVLVQTGRRIAARPYLQYVTLKDLSE